MSTRPAVSVIVPVYNQELYLAECLDSLRDQTLADIEVVCIDDGSSDASPALLDSYTGLGDRLRVIHQANAGVACARNRGLDEARGEYVLFVDSDDFIRTDACALLHQAAVENKADIVVFGGKTFPQSNWADDCFAKNRVTYTGESAQALFFEPGSNPLMCNKLYRRALLDDNQLRFNPDLHLGEDNAFQFAAFPCAQTISFIPNVLYFYRSHTASAVQAIKDDNDKRVLEHLKVVRTVVDLWSEKRYIVGREFDLLNWAVEFLNRDARFTTFQARRELSEGFAELFDRCFSPELAQRLTKTRRQQLSFILNARQALDEEPLVTVVITAEHGRAFDEDTFHALELQTEQRIEFMVVRSDDADAAWDEAVATMARDPRTRVVPSLDAAVRNARAPWMLFPTSSSEYIPTAVEQLMDDVADLALEKKPAVEKDLPATRGPIRADVVTFTDSDGLLEAQDPYACIVVDSSTILDGKLTFSAAELGNGVFHLASIAPDNKLMARSLVAAALEAAPTTSAARLALQALQTATSIHPTRMPLLTVRKLKLSEGADAARALVESMATLTHAVEEGVPASQAASLRCACAALYVTLMSTIRTPEYFSALFPLVQPQMARLEADLGDPLLDPVFAERGHHIARAASGREYFAEHTLELLHALGVENGRNLRQVGELATEIELLHEDIDRFYASKTYRVGKMVTELPRRAINFIRQKG